LEPPNPTHTNPSGARSRLPVSTLAVVEAPVH
jgi:hypothetical protein